VRDHVRAFCAAAAAAFDAQGPVIEFGSLRVAEDDGADLRGVFPGREYIGCDMRPGRGVDRIEDIAATSFASGTAGTVVCVETLEHVFAIHAAFAEMHRVLRPGGLLIAAAPFRFPIHNHPSDYWRVTPAALDRFAAPFTLRVVGTQGVSDFPHTVYLAAVKPPLPADALARAERLTAAHTRWCDAARARRPPRVKLREWTKSLYRSKGERRQIAEAFTARFEIRRGPAD
jgi:SAM-dependent methyltransferase